MICRYGINHNTSLDFYNILKIRQNYNNCKLYNLLIISILQKSNVYYLKSNDLLLMAIEKKDIEKMEYRLIDGIKNSDLKFLDKVMHDNLRGLGPNGQIITKEMDLASHREGTMSVAELIPNIEDIQIIEDTAIVIITYDTKGKMLGNPIAGRYKYNRIWKKFDDGLKIIAVSCMQVG